jgi:medium-chain acyl-[acyl-carrier-protein] hydrolase
VKPVPGEALPRRWFAGLDRRPAAAVRLFCFPYAGGSTDTFFPWIEQAPDFVEVCPVQLPGRGTRMMEAVFSDLPSMVHGIAAPLRPCLDKSFAFLGHSMGALLAFEVAHHLRQTGSRTPVYLFVSGCRAPQQALRDAKWGALSDEDLLRQILRLNYSRPEVRENPELLALTLPCLRADLAVFESYQYEHHAPLQCGITAFGGREDPEVKIEDLQGWQAQTGCELRICVLPGDHFFIGASAYGPTVLAEVASTLRECQDLR